MTAKFLSTQPDEKLRNATDEERLPLVFAHAAGQDGVQKLTLDTGSILYYGAESKGATGAYNKRAQVFLNLMGIDERAVGPAILIPLAK